MDVVCYFIINHTRFFSTSCLLLATTATSSTRASTNDKLK